MAVLSLTQAREGLDRARASAARLRADNKTFVQRLERSAIVNLTAAGVAAHAVKADKAFELWGFSGYRVVGVGLGLVALFGKIGDDNAERLLAVSDAITSLTTAAATVDMLEGDVSKVWANLAGSGLPRMPGMMGGPEAPRERPRTYQPQQPQPHAP